MNKRYWLRGGLLLGLLNLIVIFLIYVLRVDVMSLLINFPRFPLSNIVYLFTFQSILGPILWFAIGTVLGWAYGKLKSRKQFGATMN